MNESKDGGRNSSKKSTNSESVGFGRIVKYFLINYVGLIVLFPLFDLIKSGITHSEFQYNVVSHIASPVFWAILLTIFDVAVFKSREGKKK